MKIQLSEARISLLQSSVHCTVGILVFIISVMMACNGNGEVVLVEESWDEECTTNEWSTCSLFGIVTLSEEGGNDTGFLCCFTKPGGNPNADLGAKRMGHPWSGNYDSSDISGVTLDFMLMGGSIFRAMVRLPYKDYEHNGWEFPLPIAQTRGIWQPFEIPLNVDWTDEEAEAAGWVRESRSASFGATVRNVHRFEVRIRPNQTVDDSDPNFVCVGIDNVVLMKKES